MFNIIASTSWEIQYIIWLQQAASDFTTALFSIISMLGEELVMVAILGFLYWSLDKHFGEYVGFNLLTANTLNSMAKNLVNRKRPYFDYDEVKCLKPVDSKADIYDIAAQGYSFPSGHSAGSASLYPSLAFYKDNKKHRWLIAVGVIIPLLVGLSRNYLGVHYPTDVLVGWCIGLGVIVAITLLRKVVKNKYFIYLGVIAVSLLGAIYCKTNDYYTSLGMLIGFVLGVYFEEKVTKFDNTRIWWRMILRVVVGGGLFLALNTLVKLPVQLILGKEWLETFSAGNCLFRVLRYALILWLVIGVYPLSFRILDKMPVKKQEVTQEETSTQA